MFIGSDYEQSKKCDSKLVGYLWIHVNQHVYNLSHRMNIKDNIACFFMSRQRLSSYHLAKNSVEHYSTSASVGYSRKARVMSSTL